MFEAKLWHNKTETKKVKAAKMVEFIKTYDPYPSRFNFGNFFNSVILSHPFCSGKIDLQKRCLGETSFCLGVMIKTWGRVLLGGMSKNEQIQIFYSQMYLPVILTL